MTRNSTMRLQAVSYCTLLLIVLTAFGWAAVAEKTASPPDRKKPQSAKSAVTDSSRRSAKPPAPAPTTKAARSSPRADPRPQKSRATPTSSGKTPAPGSKQSDKKKATPASGPSLDKTAKAADQPAFRRDPYQLAAFFRERWDFTRFVISAAEQTQYELNAAKLKSQALAGLLARVSDYAEIRQRNLRSGVRALYLAQRACEDPFYIEGGPTIVYAVAAKSALRSDALEHARGLVVYEPLREACIREEAQRLKLEAETRKASATTAVTWERPGAAKPDVRVSPWSVTVSPVDLVAQQNERLLASRAFSVETLKSVLAAEQLLREQQSRRKLSSFAAAAQKEIEYRPLVSPDTPMPVEDSTRRPRSPEVPKLEAPHPKGQNLFAPLDTPVCAVADGKVAFSGPFRGYGRMVIVEHKDSYFSVYAYLGKLAVYEGQAVRAGQQLGAAGMLEEHNAPGIHFEVRLRDQAVEPGRLIGKADVRRTVLGR